MKQRILYLDYLKALAIFLVIIYHSKAYDDIFMPPILSYARLVMPQEYQYANPLFVLMACVFILWLFDKSRILRWFVKL